MLAKAEREAAARGEGCLGKAADDEPVFVLRAQDKFAPMIVEMWCRWVSGAALSIDDRTAKKIVEARNLADAMRLWQQNNSHRVKIPD